MKNKYCPTCKQTLTIELFHHNKTRSDNLGGQCKECVKNRQLKNAKTKLGVIKKIYRGQIGSCKARGHNLPSYTKDAFIKWCLDSDIFHDMYIKWVESDYNRWTIPSVDRINDYLSYSFSNIQILTWRENNIKSHKDRREGRNNKMSKEVVQLDKNGIFIKNYYSMSQASRDLNILVGNICNCCKGKRQYAGGFKWEYYQSSNI